MTNSDMTNSVMKNSVMKNSVMKNSDMKDSHNHRILVTHFKSLPLGPGDVKSAVHVLDEQLLHEPGRVVEPASLDAQHDAAQGRQLGGVDDGVLESLLSD
jgi:hypothetical protein